MTDDINADELDVYASEEVPYHAQALQCGHVVGDDGIIGILEGSPIHEDLEVRE